MAEYRIYFLDRKGAIQAREEFLAPTDGDAIIIGSALADACSENCSVYEIWSFARQVIGPIDAIAASWITEVSRERQKQILGLEDSIQRSRWAIAKSRRLIDKTSELRELLNENRRLTAI